jgi:hypothetical protein
MLETTVFHIHSGVRWLIVGVAVVSIVWYALVAARKVSNERVDRILMLVFSIGIDIQALLGILHLLEMLGVPGTVGWEQIAHLVIMLGAVALTHMVSARWKKADAPLRARNYLLGMVGTLALIFIAVTLLPGGLAVRWTLD